jgi:hypothetical protein
MKNYWCMQMHPTEQQEWALAHTVDALSRGIIGFGFGGDDPGDLRQPDPASRRRCGTIHPHEVLFATEMQKGDLVLVFAHNRPFALACVDGPYVYLSSPLPQLSKYQWLTHVRVVRQVTYFDDQPKDIRDLNKNIQMTSTLQELVNEDKLTRRLMEAWWEHVKDVAF